MNKKLNAKSHQQDLNLPDTSGYVEIFLKYSPAQIAKLNEEMLSISNAKLKPHPNPDNYKEFRFKD